jgi:hypothetical protein
MRTDATIFCFDDVQECGISFEETCAVISWKLISVVDQPDVEKK